MSEIDISRLAQEIDNVDFREFWWGSELLERASRTRDARVVASLARRHHCLSNKEAFSAHVIRNTIKIIDGPEFQFLWEIIDSENDSQRLVEQIENPFYLPWAAAYILGEIGGATALREVTARLDSEDQARHYLIIRIASHVVVRYLTIQNQGIVTTTMIDLKTGEITPGDPVWADTERYKMERLRRNQANEYFVPVDSEIIEHLKMGLNRIPDALFNIKRPVFIKSIEQVPIRGAFN